jgi:hypothetical protein
MITPLGGTSLLHLQARAQAVQAHAVGLRDQIASTHQQWATDEDARWAGLSRLVNVTTTFVLSLGFMNHLIQEEWWKQNTSSNFSLSDRQKATAEYLTFAKVGLVVTHFSMCEDNCRAILRALDPNAAKSFHDGGALLSDQT